MWQSCQMKRHETDLWIIAVTHTKSHAIITGMFKNIFANTFSRTEKSILSIFLALFIIPELLWSPVMNFVYDFFGFAGVDSTWKPLRYSSFLFPDGNRDALQVVLLIQFLGLFFSFLFFSSKENFK